MNALVRCSLCGVEALQEDVKHLALYVIGSEGVMACMECRRTLTDVARGIMRTAGKCRMAGYRACKEVHTANADLDGRRKETP